MVKNGFELWQLLLKRCVFSFVHCSRRDLEVNQNQLMRKYTNVFRFVLVPLHSINGYTKDLEFEPLGAFSQEKSVKDIYIHT